MLYGSLAHYSPSFGNNRQGSSFPLSEGDLYAAPWIRAGKRNHPGSAHYINLDDTDDSDFEQPQAHGGNKRAPAMADSGCSSCCSKLATIEDKVETLHQNLEKVCKRAIKHLFEPDSIICICRERSRQTVGQMNTTRGDASHEYN